MSQTTNQLWYFLCENWMSSTLFIASTLVYVVSSMIMAPISRNLWVSNLGIAQDLHAMVILGQKHDEVFDFMVRFPYPDAPWCWNIDLHLPQKWPSDVGKYSSTMEHLGYVFSHRKNPEMMAKMKKLHPAFPGSHLFHTFLAKLPARTVRFFFG